MDDAAFRKAMAEGERAFRAQALQDGQVEKTLVLQWATAEVMGLVNALHVLMAHAQAGTPGTRQLLELLVGNLDKARAVVKGIKLPDGATMGKAPDG